MCGDFLLGFGEESCCSLRGLGRAEVDFGFADYGIVLFSDY